MSAPQLHFVLDGRPEPDAPVLLLIHPLGATHEIWQPILPVLQRRFKVLRYDQRGHGQSPVLPGPHTIEALARDALSLLDGLGIARAAVCGTSLGGMVGLWLAVHAPERVERLALLGSSARAPALIASMVELVSRTDAEVYAACCEAIADWDFRGELERITAPTCVIAGALDPAAPPAHAYALGAAIPGARVHVIEQAAHLVLAERPALVGRLLLEHFEAAAAVGGEGVRRAVLGDAHVDRAQAAASDFDAPFQELITRYAWGEIWSRPGLSRTQRSIVCLSVLAALGHDEEFAMHVRAALRNGLSEAEIREVLLQLAIYAGVPVANRAFRIAGEILRGG